MRFVGLETITDKEQLMEQLVRTVKCDMPNCSDISDHRTEQLRHIESHFLVLVCGYGCGYASFQQKFIDVHINTHHSRDTLTVVHMDQRQLGIPP